MRWQNGIRDSLSARAFAFLAVVTACWIGAPLASANQIQFTAEGLINSSTMDAFQAGQSITISFVYDSSGSPQLIYQQQQGFYVDHINSLSVNSGSYSSSYSTGNFGLIDKQNNLANILDGIFFQFSANQAIYQTVNPKPQAVTLASVNSNSLNQTFSDLQLSLQGLSTTIWNDFALPTSYNLAQFDANQVIAMTFSNGQFQAGFSNLVIQDVTQGSPTPEPGTPLLLLPAIVLLSITRGARVRPAGRQPAACHPRCQPFDADKGFVSSCVLPI